MDRVMAPCVDPSRVAVPTVSTTPPPEVLSVPPWMAVLISTELPEPLAIIVPPLLLTALVGVMSRMPPPVASNKWEFVMDAPVPWIERVLPEELASTVPLLLRDKIW